MSHRHVDRDLFDDDHVHAASSRDGEIELLVSNAEMGSVKTTAAQDDDDVLYYELKNKTLLDEIIETFHNAKYVALFGMIFVAFVGYQVTVGQYQSGHIDSMARPQHTWETLQFVRPVLDANKKKSVHDNTLYGETSLHMPNNDAISFGFQRAADKYGSFPLPELFYQGVFFSIGLGNAHNVPYASVARKGAVVDGIEHVNTNGEDDVEGVEHVTTEERARLARELLVETGRGSGQQHHQHNGVQQRVSHGRALLRRLHSLKPKPMYITPRVVTNNASQWVEEGYMVYYSYKQLDAAGMLSSKNPTQPWSRVSEKLLEVAREFRQMYVTVLYAHAFGPSSTNQMLQLAEKSRRQRALQEKSGDSRYKQHEQPRQPNPRTTPYRLHQSYEEAYGISAPPQSEVDLLDDEVSFYRNAYPKGPSTKSKGFRPRRSQRSLTASSVVHPTTMDGKSVLQSVREAYTASEEETRRKLQGELRDEHGHKFETVIQMVLPTHTGLDEIKSSCAVWLSKFNHRRPSEQILKDFKEAAGATEEAARQSTGSRSLFNAPVKPSAASAKGFTFTADTADGGTKPAADAGKAEAEARELTPQESSVAFLYAAPRALFNPLGDAGTAAASATAESENDANDEKEEKDERELGGFTASRNRDGMPVQLPYFGPSSNAKEGSRRGLHETSAASTPSVDYFDFLLSYNHDAKLRVENVVFQRDWHKSFRSHTSAESASGSEPASSATIELMGDEKPRTAAGASSSTTFSFSESADQDLHWSAYVPYATAKEYAKKYGINPDFLVDREVLNRQRM